MTPDPNKPTCRNCGLPLASITHALMHQRICRQLRPANVAPPKPRIGYIKLKGKRRPD
jgi:hypothetical protein